MPTGAGEEFAPTFPNIPEKTGFVVGWLAGPGNYLVAGLSPSRKWQFYAWNRSSNTTRPATEEGMEDALPLVSPDGKQILATHVTRGWIVCAVDTAACTQLPGLTEHDQPVGWRADGRSLYLTIHHDDNRMFAISIYDLATGKRADWKMIHPSLAVDSVSNLKISPDGRAYAYNYAYLRSDLYLAR
jgi:hypothetical protein